MQVEHFYGATYLQFDDQTTIGINPDGRIFLRQSRLDTESHDHCIELTKEIIDTLKAFSL